MSSLHAVAGLDALIPSGARRACLAERGAARTLDKVGAVGRVPKDTVALALAEIVYICGRKQKMEKNK